MRARSRFDLVTTLLILVGYAIPGFMLGVALLVIFGGQLRWFPLRGLASSTGRSCPGARASWITSGITLPITRHGAGRLCVTAMLTRTRFWKKSANNMLTARVKGLCQTPGALEACAAQCTHSPSSPAFLRLFIGAFFTGSLLIETLFSLDGLGLLSYERDPPRLPPWCWARTCLPGFTLIGLVTKLVRRPVLRVGGPARLV